MILTKQQFIDSINALIPDNSSQQISPLDLRTVLTNAADSAGSFLAGLDVSAQNIGTPATTSTRLGVGALGTLGNAGTSSEDNTAVGYYALQKNYNGTDNTAVGSNALSCNLYGDHNVGIGLNAVAGNVTGSGNVGIGNFTLQSVRNGSFNIAIGHGAGNYIGQNDSYKFYLGAHGVDYGDICDSELASGLNPLAHGDLLTRRITFGGMNTLHDFGTVQVSGGVSPTHNHSANLGHGSYNWKTLLTSSGIAYPSSGDFSISISTPKGSSFPNQYDLTKTMVIDSNGNFGFGTETPSGNQGLITVGGHFVPTQDGAFAIGAPDLKWDGWFNDIIVSGNATIVDLDYTTITSCLYECKTLHLATSGFCDPSTSGLTGGALCGYLNDEGLEGAGIEAHGSGVDYVRDYKFVFRPPNVSWSCLETDSSYARSMWESNISLGVTAGQHVYTQRVLSPNSLSIVSRSGCHGFFTRINTATSGINTYIGSEDHVGQYSAPKDVTFYAPSGGNNYFLGVHTIDSGVTLGLDFATSVGSTPSGYSLEYVNRLAGDDTFVIKRNASSKDIVTVMESGFVGISNKDDVVVMPQTHLHVQGASTAEARVSSNSTNNATIRLERINTSRGFAATYNPTDDMIDLIAHSGSDARDYDQYAFLTVDPDTRYVTIGQVYNETSSNRETNGVAPLAVYHNGATDSGTIAIREQQNVPSAAAGWGKLYVRPKVTSTQQQAIYFRDDAGNEFDLTAGTAAGGLIYTYPGTTIVGSGGYGQSAATTRWTTSVGVDVFQSGTAITSGVLLGFQNAQYTTSTPTGAILIGTSLYRNETLPNYTLAIGHGSTPLVTGNMSSRTFGISNGSFSVGSNNDGQVLSISHAYENSKNVTIVDIKDNFNPLAVSGIVSFRFTDSTDDTNTFMDWDHSASGMTNTPSYVGPTGDPRPFATLHGDMKLRGALMFADGTYLDTADGVAVFAGTGLRSEDVEYGNLHHLSYNSLESAETMVTQFLTTTSYVAVSVDVSGIQKMGRMSFNALTNYVNSGTATVAHNCNIEFTDDNSRINTVANTGSVYIGCGAGVGATGWKNSLMLGSEAGYGATTANPGLALDTAAIFIGYRAGREADNTENIIALGTNAGNGAKNAADSMFLGTNAGMDIQMTKSVGIGLNALRGTGAGAGGEKNIEIVAGMDDNTRLMYGKGNFSNRLNIQNSIAGNTANRFISIGDAILGPDAPLSVRRDGTIPAHSGIDRIQTWYCDDVKVAQIDCDGEYVGVKYPAVIEGFTANTISCPSGYQWPTSGILNVYNEDGVTTREVYITHRDPSRTIGSGVFSLGIRVNKEYRPFNPGCSGV